MLNQVHVQQHVKKIHSDLLASSLVACSLQNDISTFKSEGEVWSSVKRLLRQLNFEVVHEMDDFLRKENVLNWNSVSSVFRVHEIDGLWEIIYFNA